MQHLEVSSKNPEEEEEEVGEEECKEEEEDEIRTTMQSSVAMLHSCTHLPMLSCLEEEKKEIEEELAVVCFSRA